jgi:NADPH:quinone reductase
MAAIPPQVPDAQAAALPTAGLTALRVLEVGGLVLGKRVLVTGATGGVGRMAVQLAHLAGAQVTALVRDPAAAPAVNRAAHRLTQLAAARRADCWHACPTAPHRH